MAYDLGNLLVHIRADATQYTATMGKVQKTLLATSSLLTGIGMKMSMGLTLPLAAIGAASVKVAVDLESSFTGVMKTVSATTEEFAKLKQEFRDMSRETPVALTELHAIGEAAGQLGIETENIREFTQVMAELGVTTNMAATEAATSLARMANITQMPQTEFRRLGSTVVDLGNNLATTEAEIVNMGLRLAGAGTSIGMAESEILGLAGALSSVGIQAELGGTAMTKTMLTMKSAVISGGKELRKFAAVAGMTDDAFQELFKEDSAEAIIRFVEGFDDLNKAGYDTSVMLEEMDLGGVRVVRMFESLGNAGDKLRKAVDLGNLAWEENIALTKEAELRFKTLSSQWQLAKNHLTLIAEEIGGRLTPALVYMNEKIKDLWHWWEDLSETTKNWIVWVGSAVAAIGPLLLILGLLAKAIAVVTAAITAQGLVIGGTVLLAVVALTSAYRDLNAVMRGTTDEGGGIGSWLGQFEQVQMVATRFASGMMMIAADIKYAFKQAGTGIKIAWFWVLDAILTHTAHMVESIAGLLKQLEDAVNRMPDWMKPGGDINLGSDNLMKFAAGMEGKFKDELESAIQELDDNTVEYTDSLTAIHTAMDTRLEQITNEFAKTNDKIKGQDGPFSGVGKPVANPEMEAQAGSMAGQEASWFGGYGDSVADQKKLLSGLEKEKTVVDQMLAQKEFELGITGLLNEERERAIEMREFENALQEDYTVGSDEYNQKLAEYGVLLDEIGKKQRLGEWQQAWKLYGEQVMNVWKNINDVAIGALDTIGNGITEMLTGGEFDFAAFGREVIKQLISILVKALLVYAVMMLFPGLIPIMAGMAPPIQAAQQGMATANMGMAMREGQQMGNTMSDSMQQSNSGATNSAPVTYKYHDGGEVGKTENQKNFSNDPRENRWMGYTYSKKLLDHFHGGGGIGNTALKADERVIVAQTGEVVLSREDVTAAKNRSSGGGGGGGESTPAPAPEITIVNVLDKSEMLAAVGSAEGEQVIMNTIRRNPGSIKAMAAS